MKEKLYLLIINLIIMIPLTAFSQVDWYTFSSSSGTYTEITGGTVLASGSGISGQSYNAKEIGFSFTYGKTAFTQFSVSAYGYIALGSSVESVTNPLSNTQTGTGYNNIISPFGLYMAGNTGTEIRYELSGTTPNRILTIQWKDFCYGYYPGDIYNFQVKLFETSNNVQFIYGNFVQTKPTVVSQVGLRGTSYSIYNIRTNTTDWSSTTKATSYSQTCTLSTSIKPSLGLTFNWTYAMAFGGGIGTSGDPYLISTIGDLRTLVQRGDIWGASTSGNVYFLQSANIDATQTQYWDDSDDNGDGDKYNDPNDLTSAGNNEGWPSIGNAWGWNTWFCANYDGGDHYVENIFINRSSGSYHGFFGITYRMSGGSPLIKNLGITNVNISTTIGTAGGLVGWAEQIEVLNCYTSGTVYTTGGISGGLIGKSMYNISISKSYSTCNITINSPGSTNGNNGVLIGDFNGGTVSQCFASGNITCNDKDTKIGGLIGWLTDGSVTDCYFIGDVTYTGASTAWRYNSFIGYTYGYQKSPQINNSYTVGNVYYTNFTQATDKGFTYGTHYGNTARNFWNDEVSNQNSAYGATAKTTAQMKTPSTFTDATWDFASIWAIDPAINNGYPYLQFYIPPVTPTTQSTNLQFSDISYNKFTVSWTKGSGSRRAVFVKQGSSGTTTLTDNATYTANPSFGQGTQIGTSGWYCVYNGTGTQVIVTDLTQLTSFIVKVFDYNGPTGGELYINSDATGNPASQTTTELAAPSTQASSIIFSGVDYTQMNILWTIGNGEKRAVFMKQGNSGTATPENNTSYSPNTIFGGGNQIGSTGWFCIFNGTGTNATVTNLTNSTDYIVQVFEYNGPGASEKYLTSTSSNNPLTQSTLVLSTPTTQVDSLVFSGVSHSALTASWTIGNGANRVVFMKTGNSGTTSPSDNASYTASTTFGEGTQIGRSGWFCVFNGIGTSVSVSGLTATTDYILQVFEYNGPVGAERYLTTTATDNPKSQQTGSVPLKNAFTYTGSLQNLTIPAGVNQITVKIWGAGGGGGYLLNSYSGGAGGFASGTLNVTPGQVIYIVVGGGGAGAGTSSGINLGGYGGGGNSCTSSYPHGGGAGGGYSGIFSSLTLIQANALIIAGGGGGGRTYSGESSGGGGGLTGGGATNYGGTQSSAGTAGSSLGGALQGGTKSSCSGSDGADGAGGGDAYLGGSGGGSGYLYSGIISGVLTQGTSSTGTSSVAPPNVIDGDYVNSAGYSGAASNTSGVAGSNGNSGLVVISWEAPLPVELQSLSAISKGNIVALKWKTATEINVNGFEIERSINLNTLNREFKSIGFIHGCGNSNSPKEYTYSDKEVNSGNYVYRLKMIDNDGTFKYSDEIRVSVETPNITVLKQNYPNSFNPSTKIEYQLANKSRVRLDLFGITGEIISTLIDEETEAGYYMYYLDMNRIKNGTATGVYLYKMTVVDKVTNETKSFTKKMMFMK